MRPISATIIPLALAIAIAGCGGNSDQSHKPISPQDPQPKVGGSVTTACPDHLTEYCRGWSISSASTKIRPAHVDFDDSFIIGKKSNGQDQFLWLFAQDELKDKWGTEYRVKLTEFKTETDDHDCLAGRLKLTDHDADEPHQWHKLTLRLEPLETSEIAGEHRLVVCVTPQDNGSPPSECEIPGCANEDDVRLHGGRAHARD